VYVYSNNKDPYLVGYTYPLLISKLLSKITYADIKEIKKIGRRKILAKMFSASAANKLINNPILEKENLKAFIPAYRTLRIGIIKDMPQHIDNDGIQEYLDSPCKVIEVRRLNRKVRINGEIKFLPSRTVCIKFAG